MQANKQLACTVASRGWRPLSAGSSAAGMSAPSSLAEEERRTHTSRACACPASACDVPSREQLGAQAPVPVTLIRWRLRQLLAQGGGRAFPPASSASSALARLPKEDAACFAPTFIGV